jgi:hypothetical protein
MTACNKNGPGVRREGGSSVIGLDPAVTRLPIVLVVDPVAASRFTMWRLLSQFFGVLEADGAGRASQWLARRPSIDAVVVQRKLPDADGSRFVASLAIASRAILVERPIDVRMVATSLSGWFFAQDPRKAEALLREAGRLVS